MRLVDAFEGVSLQAGKTSTVEATGVQYDSRRVRPGDIFVAMRGGATDGNRFVASAIANGAAAIVTDSTGTFAQALHVPAYLVENGRRALALIAANLLHHPERKLKISAVTGTNGKTTTAWLLEQMLRSVGRQCVLLGTIETHVADEIRPSEHTTPEASDLLQIFADGAAAGATEAIMEMSSHALHQERVYGIPVDTAIFTNLTQDHLDYHGTMEAYAAAKARLFTGVGAGRPRVSIVNLDDALGRSIAKVDHSSLMTYAIDEPAAWRAAGIELRAGRTHFEFVTAQGTIQIMSPLTGRVNVYNLLAAACAAVARGLTLDQIATAAEHLKQVPGRFQTVPNTLGITVVVDYAHTDDALRNLIRLARELVGPGKVITLFGCGGDRDRGKRSKMGLSAGQLSDLVILTSDNPRSEDPAGIIEEALTGLRQTNVCRAHHRTRTRARNREGYPRRTPRRHRSPRRQGPRKNSNP